MNKILKNISTLLVIITVTLYFGASQVQAGKGGLNIADHWWEIDDAARVVGTGGWITLMPRPGDCDLIQDIFTQYEGRINFVVRGHYPDNVPVAGLATAWAATLGNIQTSDIIYFYPWNEPNMARECGGAGGCDATDPNCVACAPLLVNYTNEVMSEFNAAGILNTKVRVLSPMINQSAPNFTNFVNELLNIDPNYFNQFYGITLNAYDFQDCGSALCHGTALNSAIGNHTALQVMGVDGKPMFAVETGVANPQGEVTDFPAFSDPSMYDLLSKSYNQAWGGDSTFKMFSPLTYNPEITDRTPWVYGGQTESWYGSIAGGGTEANTFNQSTFDTWFNSQTLVQCNDGCGYAPTEDLCTNTNWSWQGSEPPPWLGGTPYGNDTYGVPPSLQLNNCTATENNPLTSRPAICGICAGTVPKPVASCAGNFTYYNSLPYAADEGYSCIESAACEYDLEKCTIKQPGFYNCCDSISAEAWPTTFPRDIKPDPCVPCDDCKDLAPENCESDGYQNWLDEGNEEPTETEQLIITKQWSAGFTLDFTSVIIPYIGNDHEESRENYIADYLDGSIYYATPIDPPTNSNPPNDPAGIFNGALIYGSPNSSYPENYNRIHPWDPRFFSYTGIHHKLIPQYLADLYKIIFLERQGLKIYFVSATYDYSIQSWAGDQAQIISFFTPFPSFPLQPPLDFPRIPPLPPGHNAALIWSECDWDTYYTKLKAWRNLDGGKWYRLWSYVPMATREDSPGQVIPLPQQPATIIQYSDTNQSTLAQNNPFNNQTIEQYNNDNKLLTNQLASLVNFSPQALKPNTSQNNDSISPSNKKPILIAQQTNYCSRFDCSGDTLTRWDYGTDQGDEYCKEVRGCGDGCKKIIDDPVRYECQGSIPTPVPPSPTSPPAPTSPPEPTPTPAPDPSCSAEGDCCDVNLSCDSKLNCTQVNVSCDPTSNPGAFPSSIPPVTSPTPFPTGALLPTSEPIPPIPGTIAPPPPWIQVMIPHLARAFYSSRISREVLEAFSPIYDGDTSSPYIDPQPGRCPAGSAVDQMIQNSAAGQASQTSNNYLASKTNQSLPLPAQTFFKLSESKPENKSTIKYKTSKLSTIIRSVKNNFKQLKNSMSSYLNENLLSHIKIPITTTSYPISTNFSANYIITQPQDIFNKFFSIPNILQPNITYAQGSISGVVYKPTKTWLDLLTESGGPCMCNFCGPNDDTPDGKGAWYGCVSEGPADDPNPYAQVDGLLMKVDIEGWSNGVIKYKVMADPTCKDFAPEPCAVSHTSFGTSIGPRPNEAEFGPCGTNEWYSSGQHRTLPDIPFACNGTSLTVSFYLFSFRAHACGGGQTQSVTCTFDGEKNGSKCDLSGECEVAEPPPPGPKQCGLPPLGSVPQCTGTIRTGPGDPLCGEQSYLLTIPQDLFWNANPFTSEFTDNTGYGDPATTPGDAEYNYVESRCGADMGCENCACVDSDYIIRTHIWQENDYGCDTCTDALGASYTCNCGCDTSDHFREICADENSSSDTINEVVSVDSRCSGAGSVADPGQSNNNAVVNPPDHAPFTSCPMEMTCMVEDGGSDYDPADADAIYTACCVKPYGARTFMEQSPLCTAADYPTQVLSVLRSRQIALKTNLPYLKYIRNYTVLDANTNEDETLYKFVTPYRGPDTPGDTVPWYEFHDGEASGWLTIKNLGAVPSLWNDVQPSSVPFFFPYLGGIQDGTSFVRDCLTSAAVYNPATGNVSNGCDVSNLLGPGNTISFWGDYFSYYSDDGQEGLGTPYANSEVDDFGGTCDGSNIGDLSTFGSVCTGGGCMDDITSPFINGVSPVSGTTDLIYIPPEPGGPDTNAPQLPTLFSDGARNIQSIYHVNSISHIWGASVAGFATTSGENILVPNSGYNIGGGCEVRVLYATNDSITIKYTREDSVAGGYTIHLQGLAVDPAIVSAYNSWESDRTQLPSLASGQPLGTGTGGELKIVIRDTGQYMDPRSQTDWWQ